jgi:hypothetical protein
VTVSGTVSATSYENPSDRRLKTNVAPLEARSRHLFSLNGVSFNYKKRPDGTVHQDGAVDVNATHFGFIAQEVEGRFPELVGRSPDGMRSVQYSAFVPLIVEGMKTLRSDLAAGMASMRSDTAAAVRERRATTVTVKGLAATGAVTAHHGLAQRSRSPGSGDGIGDTAAEAAAVGVAEAASVAAL